jgi:hypothetical protein
LDSGEAVATQACSPASSLRNEGRWSRQSNILIDRL